MTRSEPSRPISSYRASARPYSKPRGRRRDELTELRGADPRREDRLTDLGMVILGVVTRGVTPANRATDVFDQRLENCDSRQSRVRASGDGDLPARQSPEGGDERR